MIIIIFSIVLHIVHFQVFKSWVDRHILTHFIHSVQPHYVMLIIYFVIKAANCEWIYYMKHADEKDERANYVNCAFVRKKFLPSKYTFLWWFKHVISYSNINSRYFEISFSRTRTFAYFRIRIISYIYSFLSHYGPLSKFRSL